ncbi:MAG: phosphoenolpyruvate carboxykinase (ATP) [Cytophagales bacterium]|nr:phosphoenolpyruvate carboxykinase (ATP) [Cytophagales bacterium]
MRVPEYSFFSSRVHINLSPTELVERSVQREEAILCDTGALMCKTGRFTGRSPQDRFILRDELTEKKIDWGTVNQGINTAHYQALYKELSNHLKGKEIYVRDAYVGADPQTRIGLRVFNTWAWHNLFCQNMFISVPESERTNFSPNYTLLVAPDFKVEEPLKYGLRNPNFVVLNLSEHVILIGGTGYAGEMKKSMFTVMNFRLPEEHGILPMHCAANLGKDEDTAIFFGLSGTGKTTLSADTTRSLVGDDEHGWSSRGIFNFEGGCYAKVINLTSEQEPQIWNAIRFGSIVENTAFFPNTRQINYADQTITENTRASYPLSHIAGARYPSLSPSPKHVFFLTADAFGTLPPISKLNPAQAMYYFLSGYTAKVAGTETGITEPQAVFSACFGAPFLPLSPVRYARMLAKLLEKHKACVWLVNTGWSGGEYGVGKRISLNYTRTMIRQALNGDLEKQVFQKEPIFGLSIPMACKGVPEKILNPEKTWTHKEDYQKKARQLLHAFRENFKKYDTKELGIREETIR